MEEMRNCTFKPKIRSYVNKSSSSNMSKLMNESHLKSPSISQIQPEQQIAMSSGSPMNINNE